MSATTSDPTRGWPDTCSFCSAPALSSFYCGALCADHYRTFFAMHDALNRVNEISAPALVVALQQIRLAPLSHGDEAIAEILRIADEAIAAAEIAAASREGGRSTENGAPVQPEGLV
jgi:hypothetical protein